MSTGNLNLDFKWGPFSPLYTGISHILNPLKGMMADMALFTGTRNPYSIVLPDNNFAYVQNMQSGDRRASVHVIPENVAPDYSSYDLKFFLEHGDTATARFNIESDELAHCTISFRNTSEETREYFWGMGLTVSDAQKKVFLKNHLKPWWLPARNYNRIEAYQKVFGLGCRQCLTRVFSWGIEDEVLAQAFGGWMGDRVSYQMKLPKPLQNGFIYLRYIKYSAVAQTWEIRINGKPIRFSFPQTWEIPGGGWGKNRDTYEEWRLLKIPTGPVASPGLELELLPLDAPENDTARIWLDGILFSEGEIAGTENKSEDIPTSIIDEMLNANLKVELEKTGNLFPEFSINSDDGKEYCITVSSDISAINTMTGNASLLSHLRRKYNRPSPHLERDTAISQWGLIESDFISIPPLSEKTISFNISIDEKTAKNSIKLKSKSSGYFSASTSGPYAELSSHLKDIILFNINYPFRIFDTPSHYYVPAKYFPLPYSWDGGFIAMGLAYIETDLALKQTKFFLADGKHEFPFLYCGSPVPTQFYAIWEIYQRTCDKSVLSSTYLGAKRMYDFYLGRGDESIVNANHDGLLSTYPYNYNLGIDDHPIQRWAEKCQITKKGLYSIILMTQILRIAQIMRNIAYLLDIETDMEQYGQDVKHLENIIERQMWDEESGLYGWLHRTDNRIELLPLGGSRGDRSACAFLPLFAGLSSHKKRLLGQMLDTERFLTQFGISSVDMSAPYYNPNGYWNGGIWPVMQWYLWRGLLEAGEPLLARQIAVRILDTWKNSFDSEHYLGEHFMIAPEKMNGAPNFGGLSAVLLPMCAAYFEKYHVTTSYDAIILDKTVDSEKDTMSLSIIQPFFKEPPYNLLVNMAPGKTSYKLTVNGSFHGEFISDEYGHLLVPLQNASTKIFLEVSTPVSKQ